MDTPTIRKTSIPEKLAIDEFVRNYLANNPNSNKTEALQKWNGEKSRRDQYMSKFEGTLSLGRLPPDAQRRIISKVPGATFSTIPRKKEQTLLVSSKQFCTEPITVNEFKKFLRTNIKKIEKGLVFNAFTVSYVSGYGVIEKVNGEEHFVKSNLPCITTLRIMEESQYSRSSDKIIVRFLHYFIMYGNRATMGRIRDGLFYGNKRAFTLESDTGIENRETSNIPNDYYISRETLSEGFEELLDAFEFPDSPYVYLDALATREIINNRVSCSKEERERTIAELSSAKLLTASSNHKNKVYDPNRLDDFNNELIRKDQSLFG